MTGVLVTAAVLWWLASSATFGPNGGTSAYDLPAGWWVIFGAIALVAGGVAALLVDAAFGGPATRRRRRRPPSLPPRD